MKLHRNRKRNKFNKLISLALVCCMTLSMGSSYVNAGEVSAAMESSEAFQESQEAAESVTPQIEMTGNQTIDQNSKKQNSNSSKLDRDENSTDELNSIYGSDEQGTVSNLDVSGSDPGTGASDAGPDGAGVPGSDPIADGLDTGFGGMDGELTEEELEAIYEELIAFEELPEDEVGAVTYPDLGMGTFSMVRGESWSFDIHYVNQADPNYVEMTRDFNLKYQMEFHANANFAAKDIIIRMPKALLWNRDGEPVDYTDIAVNKVNSIDDKPIPSKSTPFNFYIEEDDLVFFNYTEIKAGTNAAWQVLYKKIRMMDLWDEDEWSLQPTITVKVPQTGGTDKIEEKKEPAPLKGKVDSFVKITNVGKSAFRDTDKVYTPELYTKAQVGKYIEGGEEAIPAQIKKNFDDYVYMLWSVTVSGSANQPWNLYVDENPWVEDSSNQQSASVGEDGKQPCVVGYKSNTNSTYRIPVTIRKYDNAGGSDEPDEGYEASIAENRTENWGTRFWVVTAYPKSMVYDKEGKLKNNTLVNNINVNVWGDGDYDYRQVTQKWIYREYKWEYTGDILDIEKKSDETVSDPRHYTGWLELYETALERKENGYGGIPFHTVGSLNSFKLTHNVTGEGTGNLEYGSYIPGSAAELTTVDDVMYLRLGTKGIKDSSKNPIPDDYMLTREDYYYTSVTVTQRDVGFDLWEGDDTVLPESLEKYYKIEDDKVVGIKDAAGNVTPIGSDAAYAEDFNQNVYIYAMFAKDKDYQTKTEPENPEKDWEPAGEVKWNDSGVMTYAFTQDQIRREPYRVKAVHKTINYRTTCNIDVEVFIKKGSQLDNIIEAYNSSVKDESNTAVTGDAALEMTMEDLSGVWGVQYSDGRLQDRILQDTSTSSFNYAAPEYIKTNMNLETESRQLHSGIKPYRDSATKLVTGLAKEAHAFKYASEVDNDVTNERGLVNYYLTAYDGYKMYSRDAMNYLMRNKDGEDLKPGRQKVVFYDLLPYGMHFDHNAEIVAGQLDNLSGGYYQREDSYWNKSVIQEIKPEDVEVTENYRETGRTLVAFHLTYTGSDSSIYTNQLWMEGWGIRFGAYFDWKDMAVVQEGANVFAFMPDVDDPRYGTKDLCGTPSQVAYDNGDLFTIKESDRDFYKDLVKPDPKKPGSEKGDINGNGSRDDRMNVLYAHNVISDEIATGAMSTFEKRVRASDEGSFGKSAVVEPEKSYTYDITVRADAGNLSDIVIFDRLENAKADRAGVDADYNYEDAVWHGIFDSVITTGLEQKGITPVIYYRVGSVGDLAEIADRSPEGVSAAQSVVEYLKSESKKITVENPITADTEGWVTREAYEAAGAGARPSVKAVAVYLTDDKGNSYTLRYSESATFQIRMTAPDWDEIKGEAGLTSDTEDGQLKNYAYNNPYYYSALVTEQEGADGTPILQTTGRGLLAGNTVSVSANPYGSLEVFKEFDESVPASEDTTPFRIRLQWKNDNEKTAAGKVYEVYEKTAGGVWEKKERREVTPEGYFTLHAGEKAVFTGNLPDVKNIEASEDLTDVFWDEPEVKYNTKTKPDLQEEGTRNITVINKYRPVLYVQKILDGMPEGVPESDKVFTFQLRVKKKGEGEFQSLGGVEYYLVNEDGILTQKGITVSKEDATDNSPEGTFQISEGEKLAFFPGELGTSYELEELNSDKWICIEPENTKTGTLNQNVTTAKITNYYRFKDLYLTKKLTHQPAEADGTPVACTQTFKFQVVKVDSNDQEQTVTARNKWQVYEADENGRLKLDDENRPIPATGDHTSGTLGSDGTFEANCGGKIVKISGLELEQGTRDAIYVIREVESEADYRPVNDSCEFVIHHSDESVRGTITNDYLYRPLSVTKMVLYDYGNGQQVTPATNEFEMKVQVETEGQGLQPLANKYYTAKKDGVTREGVTNDQGEFILYDGETAVFEKAGKLGQSFTVSEKQDAKFPQIRTGAVYPDSGVADDKVGEAGEYGDPYHGTISGEAGEATIINGSGEYLLIRKEYVGDSEKEEQWIEQHQYDYCLSPEFSLKVTEDSGETVEWPREEDVVTEPNAWGEEEYVPVTKVKADGKVEEAKWHRYSVWESTFTISPNETVIIPLTRLEGVKSYTLCEDSDHQHFMVPSDDGVGYYQISQREPANDAAYTGNLDTDRLAVICNEVRYVEPKGKTVYKWMDVGSDEVAPGTELVWKLEKYTGGSWEAASDVGYLSFDGTGITCEEILYPDEENGKIVLKKGTDNGMSGQMSGFPYIKFVEEDVKPELNLYDSDATIAEGTYRLTELQMESSGWGKLAGYGKMDLVDLSGTIPSRFASDGRTSNLYSYSMDVKGEDAVAFVNSNRLDAVEIEKQMTDGTASTDSFTMILKQVVSAVTGSDGKTVYNTIPAANVTYQLYSSKKPGTPIEVEGETEFLMGDGGEIYLRAGQYAKLELPDKTQWIVSEQERDGYKLDNLTSNPGSTKLQQLSENEMLINPSRKEAVPVGLTVTKVKGQGAVSLVPGRKWWRVNKSDTLNKNDFEVYGIYSDGSRVKLEPNDFEIPQIEGNNFTQYGRIEPVKVTWKGKTTTAEISVVQEKELSGLMIGGTDQWNKYFAGTESDSMYKPLAVKSGEVYISEYIAAGPDEAPENIKYEYRITGIGREAYQDNSDITSITAPFITKINKNAFTRSGLKSIEAENVTEIEAVAFSICQELEQVNFPSAETIGERAFNFCFDLESVILPEAKTIGESAFCNCKVKMLDLPSATDIGKRAFEWCSMLESVYLPNAESFGAEVFNKCSASTESKKLVVKIRELTNINVDAFGGMGANLTIQVIGTDNEFLKTCLIEQPQYGFSSTSYRLRWEQATTP